MKPFESQTHYEVLEVSVSADADEVRGAWARLKRLYAQEQVALYGLVDPVRAERLQQRLDEARAVLTDDAQRDAYDASIGLPPREGARAVAPVEAAPAEVAAPPPPPAPAPELQETEAVEPVQLTFDEVRAPSLVTVRATSDAVVDEPPSPPVAPAPTPEPPVEVSASVVEAAPEVVVASESASTPVQELLVEAVPMPAAAEPGNDAPAAPAPDAPHAEPAEPPAPAPAVTDAAPPADPVVSGSTVSVPPLPLVADAEPGVGDLASTALAVRSTPREHRPEPRARPHEVPPGVEFNGDLLRQVRMARGLSLLQLSERTRISQRHLENVEADRYELLPAGVYLRGILMSLSRELGLDGLRVSKSYLAFVEARRAKG